MREKGCVVASRHLLGHRNAAPAPTVAPCTRIPRPSCRPPAPSWHQARHHAFKYTVHHTAHLHHHGTNHTTQHPPTVPPTWHPAARRHVCRAASAPSGGDAAAKVCGSLPYVRPCLSRRIYIERRGATVQSALHATPHPSPPQIPGLAPAPPPFHTVWACRGSTTR